MKKGTKKTLLAASIATLLLSAASTQAAPTHDKAVIGYLTQWEAWKGSDAGFSVKGEATHLNVDMDKYSILNFSFFGVAKDGSLHSGDYRNKQIYQSGSVQEPAPLLHTDVYSSWDLHILWGELEYLWEYPGDEAWQAEKLAKVRAQGFVPHADGWEHQPTGITGGFPIPLKKEGGAPGLIDLAHQKGVKVMASLGGWSMSKHFPEMAADPVKKARFLADIDRLMALGFDGIDIDWEYPGFGGMNFGGSPEDYDNFEQLMEDIRSRIGDDKLLTAAFSASTAKLEGYDWARLSRSMDYFNMMTYDLNGGWSNVAGHNAPLYPYPEEEYQGLNLDHLRQWMADKGIASEKINFGAAFYGRGVQTTESTAYVGAPTDKRSVNFSVDGPTMSAVDLVNWSKFEGQPSYNYIIQQTGWSHEWDANAQVPYAVNGKYFLSYDDPASIEKKAQYVMDHNLGGIIVWQVAGDIKCEGSFVSYGSKLKQCTNLKSPLAEKIDQVFSQNVVPNTAPTLTVPSAQQVDSGQSISFDVSATDADGDAVSFSASEATVTDLGNGQARITYMAPLTTTDVTKSILITVSDGRAQTSKSVIVNVKGSGQVTNSAPELTVPSTQQVNSGESIAISVSATDADGDALTFTSSQGTLTQSGNSAVIHYTAPQVAQDSTESIVITVSDGTDSVSKTVTVSIKAQSSGGDSTWDPTKVYLGGDEVIHNGTKYTAKWWTQGNEPGTNAVWEEFDDGSTKEWEASKVYTGGKLVTYQGDTYKAKWWTKGDQPGTSDVWQKI
ncbi:glycosyl hydrolase family 18 protein [Vibrio sp. SCSIO 43136]|uniref:glycosyl hydrolase family 18 protein n=1 Tax=Vibrio sp. SCSIO 43136 TaxID=2819101 RepID=UPI0020765129|nr:glycosyl hydrolase family 18 protein [Vibrio sp. SCSIO 43136]USD67054.1 chitinase [Vibrio sp. SCSIO 43136]